MRGSLFVLHLPWNLWFSLLFCLLTYIRNWRGLTYWPDSCFFAILVSEPVSLVSAVVACQKDKCALIWFFWRRREEALVDSLHKCYLGNILWVLISLAKWWLKTLCISFSGQYLVLVLLVLCIFLILSSGRSSHLDVYIICWDTMISVW
jgi:hypothetical protein